jgi:1,4-alpha-glucan branching enzyme
MHLVDELHKRNIGVILDWVPSHFPGDGHGLALFDGTHLFEYADPLKGFHPDWKSYIFNYERNEVRSFLISNALFWLDKYHIDGLRVDAVASMLYLDYSRNHGEWIPNIYGGRENLEAVSFLQEFNDAVHRHHPDAITIAEESTAWPGVTRKVSEGGLGFDLKWMMGWMHDTLNYFQYDPVFRKYHHDMITFSMHYFFSEKFMLPLSHDEVVYGKKSLLNKMPGDKWQQFANLRLLFSYMYLHPGTKIIFMGGEFAQSHEWRHDFSLDWHENELPEHKGIQLLVKELNKISIEEKSLYVNNFDFSGFRWLDIHDRENSVICWVRNGTGEDDQLIIVANFTPVVRENYRIGVPLRGHYTELFNSDDEMFGGSNVHNQRVVRTAPIARHNQQQSLSLTLPPLAIIVLKNIKLTGYKIQSGA